MPAIGRRLAGRYRIDAMIGSGGFATVYRAHDLRLDRDVAVKVLLPNHADDPIVAQRFDREARTLAALSHPNVVAIHDVEPADPTSDAEPFLVMELCAGGSLADRLSAEPDGRLSPMELVPILVDAASGLEALHERGIVHRDVKPSNILLTDGRARIADLGIAAAGPSDLTAPGTALGTLPFLGPELLAGRPAHLASDVHALGAVAFLGLTGKLPRSASSVAGLVEESRRPVGPVSAALPALGSAFDGPVAAALALDPSDRPTAAEFGASMAAALESWSARAAGTNSTAAPSAAVSGIAAASAGTSGIAAASAGTSGIAGASPDASTSLDLMVPPPPSYATTPSGVGDSGRPREGSGFWSYVSAAAIIGALLIAAGLLLSGTIRLPGSELGGLGASASPSTGSARSSASPPPSAGPSANPSVGPSPTSAAYAAAAAASKAMRDTIAASQGGPGGLKGKDAHELESHLDRFDQALTDFDAAKARDEADAEAKAVADILDHEKLGDNIESNLTAAAGRLVRAADALPG